MTSLDDTQLALMLAALGHPLRLRIFRYVMTQGPDGLPAGTISAALNIGSSNLSFHLKELRQAGWLASERRGQHIFYRACYERVQYFMDVFQTRCCADAPTRCRPVCGSRCQTTDDSKKNEDAT